MKHILLSCLLLLALCATAPAAPVERQTSSGRSPAMPLRP